MLKPFSINGNNCFVLSRQFILNYIQPILNKVNQLHVCETSAAFSHLIQRIFQFGNFSNKALLRITLIKTIKTDQISSHSLSTQLDLCVSEIQITFFLLNYQSSNHIMENYILFKTHRVKCARPAQKDLRILSSV